MISGFSEKYRKEGAEIAALVKSFLIAHFFAGTDKKILSLKKELFEGKLFEIGVNVGAFLESDLPTADFLLEIAKKLEHCTDWLQHIAESKSVNDAVIEYLISSEMGYMTMVNLLSNEKTSKAHAMSIMRENPEYGFISVADSRFAADLLDEFQKEINLENIQSLMRECYPEKGESKSKTAKSNERKKTRLHQLAEILGGLLSNPVVPTSFLIDCVPIISLLHENQVLRFYYFPTNCSRGGHVNISRVLENQNLPKEILNALVICADYDNNENYREIIKTHQNYKLEVEVQLV